MSQIPSDPGTDGRRRSVTYDELIALFVAFLTLGSVLFWGLTRSGVNLFGNASLFGDGTLPLVGETDSDNPLAIADLTEELEDLSLDTLDEDGEVGFGDLTMVLASWGEVVGMGDLLQVLGNWGPCL